MEDIKFIIPAAGIAARLDHCGYPKELLPIAFLQDAEKTHPLLAIEYSLRALSRADVRSGCIVISPNKLEIARYIKDGGRYGLNIVYSIQAEPTGLLPAITTAAQWMRERSICLALPDTLFRPDDALKEVRGEFERTGADLVLGVFPTNEPERLGPVAMDAKGRVTAVQDKPENPCAACTWGLAMWRPRVTKLINSLTTIHANLGDKTELALGNVFHEAVSVGLDVRAVVFPTGCFIDIGTPAGLFEALESTKRIAPNQFGLPSGELT